jgi:transcription antitermination factor NusG
MDGSTIIDEVERWAALRTAARWEKAVTEQLAAAGVPVFLPLLTRASRTRGKSRTAQLPVFPGYVFCGEREYRDGTRVPASCRKLIAQLLRAPDPDRLKDELRAVAALLANRQLLQERVYGAIGDTVRIVGGPLVGSLGTILRLKPGTSRVVIEVSFLGARLEATVEERVLEKAVPTA